MNQEMIKRSLDKMNLEYEVLKQNPDRVDLSHFVHLAGNILQGMAWFSHGPGFDWENQRTLFLTNWQQLRTYFDLINESPEFKLGELGSQQGYFTLAPSQTNKEYICYATQQLRGKK